MNRLTWSEFRMLPIHSKFLLSGHTLMVLGGSCLAFGSLLEMLKEGGLPNSPVTLGSQSHREVNGTLYGGKRSYFES